jgi:ABC-2 type transport system permease protein
MNLQELSACIVKELRLLARDIHGLALLFVMPAAFILIMSLALKDQFEARAGKKITVDVVDHDQSTASHKLLDRLRQSDAFTLTEALNSAPGHEMFSLVIDKGYGEQLVNPAPTGSTPPVTLGVAPDAARQTQLIVVAAIREALGREGVDELVETLRTMMQSMSPNSATNKAATPKQDDSTDALDKRLFQVRYAYSGGAKPPTSVQQNVPAWLVFAIFFVVIPVSNAVIRERQVGTLRRIRTTRVSNATLLLGKLIPYYAINLVQVIVMMLIGMFVVPRLGGDALVLNGSISALFVIASAVSIAALGYALLIAVIAKTTEQATIIGGAGNIILAALGGIMVPKFVMPLAMQNLTHFSPMSWGLTGFLDVLLRGGNVQSVLSESTALVALGVCALLLAGVIQSRSND